jgi:hypothetical protein
MLLPVIMRYRVTNPDAADYGKEGVAINILDESDLQQRTIWIVLDFGGGAEPVAFHKDELTRLPSEL